MDQELRAYLEEMEARIGARMGEQFSQIKAQVETDGRQTRVLVEGMHDHIRLLAEGVIGVTERLETFQAETAGHFSEIKATFSPVYQNLGGQAHSLDSRVRVLEARADRQTEDVLESIRKKFGKPQA